MPKLFSGSSPHSNYLCQGVLCAPGNQQPAVEQFRLRHTKPTFIEPDGSRTVSQ